MAKAPLMRSTFALAFVAVTLWSSTLASADKFHIKVKFTPDPPDAGQLNTMTLGLYNFNELDLVEWEDIHAASLSDGITREPALQMWIVASDFNHVAHYEFPYDSFHNRTTRFPVAPTFPVWGRYIVTVRMRLPLGDHKTHPDKFLEQAFVPRVAVESEVPGFAQPPHARSWLNKFQAPHSLRHHPWSHYDGLPMDQRHQRNREFKFDPVSPELADEALHDAPMAFSPKSSDSGVATVSERHDALKNMTGVPMAIFSHTAPLPPPAVDENGDLVPVQDTRETREFNEADMYKLEVVTVKEELENDVIVSVTAAGDRTERAKPKCRKRDEQQPETDYTQCMAVHLQLTSCRVCLSVGGEEAAEGEQEEEVCVADMACKMPAELEALDLLVTRPYVVEEFGGNYFLGFKRDAKFSKNDHVEGQLAVPTTYKVPDQYVSLDDADMAKASSKDFTGMRHHILGDNKTICPDDFGQDLKVYDNGTVVLLHRFDDQGYHHGVAKFRMKDKSTLVATFGIYIPLVPEVELPVCDDDEGEDDGEFEGLLKKHMRQDDPFGIRAFARSFGVDPETVNVSQYTLLLKVVGGAFGVTFVLTFLVLMCTGKKGKNVDLDDQEEEERSEDDDTQTKKEQ
jgi:hypothetical protein